MLYQSYDYFSVAPKSNHNLTIKMIMITFIIDKTKYHNVQQVAQVRGGNGLDWVAVDAKEMPEELAREEKNKGGGGGGGVGGGGGGGGGGDAGGEAKVRKRVDSVDGDYTSKGQDVAKDQIMDSANHSHGHKESPNVVYYKVRIKKTCD